MHAKGFGAAGHKGSLSAALIQLDVSLIDSFMDLGRFDGVPA